MKNTTKILLLLLVCAIVITSFVITSCATDVEVAAATDSDFMYTSGGVSKYSTSGQTLKDVISLADAGSEIEFLRDVIIDTPAYSVDRTVYSQIKKGLTLNLGGHTLYFSQSHKSSSFFQVSTTEQITVKNGTLVWNINQKYANECNTGISSSFRDKISYALFSISNNDANLTFDSIKAYGGTLAYSYQGSGIKINVKGSEYHANRSADLYGNSMLDFRANVTVDISDTLIDLQNTDTAIFTLTSYKEKTSAPKTTATLTDCTIVGSASSSNLLPNMNNYTTVAFNNCTIFGSINPSKYSGDNSTAFTVSNPVDGSVLLGQGTCYMADATMKSGVVVNEDGCPVKTVSLSKLFNISTSSGSMYTPSNITFTTKTNTKSYTFTRQVGNPPLPKFTATFYKEDGKTVITTISAESGTAVTPPEYVAGESNGWYTSGFDGWTTVYGSSNKVTSFIITKNTSYYPAVAENTEEAKPHLTAAQYNLNFTGSVILNFYLPRAPKGITNVKVVDKGGNVLEYREVLVSVNGEKLYHRLYEIASLSPIELTSTKTVTVYFDLNDVTLSQTIDLSPVRYAKTILKDSKSASPVWSSQTHTMMADMIRYSNYLSYAAKGEYVDELTALTDTYESLCTPLPSSNDFSNFTTTMNSLSGYVSSVQFAISDFKPQWIINLNSSKKVTDVSISLDGYLPSPDEKTGTNYGTITYGVDKSRSAYSGSYLVSAYIESMPVYNMDRDITVTVTVENGQKITATYSLDTYFNQMSTDADTLYNYQLFLRAFRAFGQSAAGYKYANGIISPTVPEKDFFDCNHSNAKTKSFTENNGRYCDTCKTYIFFYDDFINLTGRGGEIYTSRDAAMAGKVNSYSAIDFCHAKANNVANSGHKVGCVATPGAVYYLGYSYDYSGKVDEITVQCDTQWDGAYILSDESQIQVGDPAFNKPLFCVRGTAIKAPDGISYSASGTDVTKHFTATVKAGASKVPFSTGSPMMLELTDSSVKHYTRTGGNANDGKIQSEVILIDEFGNVSNTTPIEWDYVYSMMCTYACTFTDANADGLCDTCAKAQTQAFKVKAYNVTDKPIKISGLDSDGNISAKYENITNNSVDASAYKTVGRGITARRSNVTVEGIYHIFTEDNTKDTPRQAYGGFVKAWLGCNIVCKDLSVWQHMNHYITGTSNLLGSYEFNADSAINVSWINCKVRNFFNSDGSLVYMGLFGTNGTRNMYLRDCLLTSFDAHTGAGNVTIENSTFEHLNFIGAGNIRLNDVTVYQSSGGRAAIILRQDYGSRWRGNLYIDGLELRYDASNYTYKYIDLVRAHYSNNNYSYGNAQGSNEKPANIYANNVSIMQYSRKSSANSTVTFGADGKVYETILTKGTIPLALYTQLNSELKNSSYDYSTINTYNKNPLGCTQNVYITNSDVSIAYPTHKFFKNMKVYINGVQQDWY